jgi:hypothetical protein
LPQGATGWRLAGPALRYRHVLDLRPTAFHVLCALGLLGCSSQAIDSSDDETATGGSGTVSAPVTLVDVYTPKTKTAFSATALAFNPTVDGELWVVLRQFPSGKPCTMDVDTGCSALRGVMGVVSGATTDTPAGVLEEDGNSWHFMRRPSAIAWGDGQLFSTCGEALTDNYEDDATPYAGPALWSSDPSIFGVEPLPEQNGTHLDMLHETPLCMGLAHESANAFWAFNGLAGSLDRVDFHSPHQIGGEDHSDGEVHRYIAGQLARTAEVPGHIAYDRARSLVYVADTGHGRVLSVDPSTAVPGDDIAYYEKLHESGMMDGATVKELVRPGLVQKPSGLTLAGDVLYVTDNATSMIYAFDTAGKLEKTFDTALPPGSLAGITVGPDSKLYVADLLTGTAHRVEAALE